MTSQDITSKYPIGSTPEISFVAYVIFCSFVVSLIGAITTVELLHRRGSRTGWRSWVQLAGCSVSFGLVAIWCMHFVGNRAIVLGDGEGEIQLYYSSSFTVISAVIPVVVLFVGLLVADRFQKKSAHTVARLGSLILCAFCAGAAITEMHYLGNNGTTNYQLRHKWSHVVGAASIAVGASWLSFGLFFHWSGMWMNNFLRRMVVACFLAIAVSGMHWTAAAGTKYEIRGYYTGSGKERNTNLIIAICLSLSACAVCFFLGFLEKRQRKMLKDRAQQVVLACATFDENGRLLVSQGGLLPSQTITRQFHQRTFDDEFTPSHPVFQWLFRVSRHWTGIVELIPSMREHLQLTGYLSAQSPATTSDSRSSMESDDDSSYSATFRELFCVTAHEIAKTLDTGLQNLGVLYEEVVSTGTSISLVKTVFKQSNRNVGATDVGSTRDMESGLANPIQVGKGQLLVLTKQVDSTEVKRLETLGYHFASVEQVGENLARSLQIPRDDLEAMVGRWQSFNKREPVIPKSGIYLASFLLQPAPGVRGMEVIVPRDNPHRLPMVKLTSNELTSRQLSILSAFNGHTLDDCLVKTRQRPGREWSEDDRFLERFHNRMLDLVRDVPESALQRAVFSSRQLDIAHGVVGQEEHSPSTMFAFCGIKEIYVQAPQSLTLKCIPLSFLQTQLRSYPGSPDHAILAQKNHKEFSFLLQSQTLTKAAPEVRTGKWTRKLRSQGSISSDLVVRGDSCSEKGLVDTANPADMSKNPWGTIMVTSTREIVVDETKTETGVELRELGVKSSAGVAEGEALTVADWLMSITTAFRDPHAMRGPRDLHYGRRQ